jgi:hypothetical protein
MTLHVRHTVLLLVATVGCAPTLSGFQPGHVAPKGHVTVEAGLDVSARQDAGHRRP